MVRFKNWTKHEWPVQRETLKDFYQTWRNITKGHYIVFLKRPGLETETFGHNNADTPLHWSRMI